MKAKGMMIERMVVYLTAILSIGTCMGEGRAEVIVGIWRSDRDKIFLDLRWLQKGFKVLESSILKITHTQAERTVISCLYSLQLLLLYTMLRPIAYNLISKFSLMTLNGHIHTVGGHPWVVSLTKIIRTLIYKCKRMRNHHCLICWSQSQMGLQLL